MSPAGASGFAVLATVGSLGALAYQDLSHGGLGSHGGAKRYVAVAMGGAIAILVAPVVPLLGVFLAGALMFATVVGALSKAKGA